MRWLVRLFGRVSSLLPLPRDLDDRPTVVDPRVDPASLDTFGREQIAQFGPGQGHSGAPLPTRYATDAAADARDAEHHRVDD